MNHPSTFSIVAYDPERREWGVAVQSKFLAAAAVVSWARAGAGAVATQSYANTSYGPRALDWMAQGMSAQEAIARLVADDEGRAQRQVGLVDAQGNAASFTGEGCLEWAGHIVGKHYACQGNILVDERTVKAMAETFESTASASGELGERLVAALAAGQAAGGDRRGQQAAGLLVVREGGGYAGFNDRYIDLRVDDDPQPIEKLRQLLELHHLYFGTPGPEDWLRIEGEIAQELQRMAAKTGWYSGPILGKYDAATRTALRDLIGVENLEERFREDEGAIDTLALKVLRERVGT
jgi:uncharacterized Ntn-hydrolase superfamily protein